MTGTNPARSGLFTAAIMSDSIDPDAEALLDELQTWRPTKEDGTFVQERIDQLDQVRGACTTVAWFTGDD